MTFRDKNPKRKVNSDGKCYNCYKISQFGWNCFFTDRMLNKNTQQSWREESRRGDSRRGKGRTWGSTLNRAHQATKNKSTKYDGNIDPEYFAPRRVRNAFMVRERLQKHRANHTWFFDLYISRHFCNNRRLFSNLKHKNINFVIAVEQDIRIKEISTVSISLAEGNSIELENVALVPGCDSNIISLVQL